MLIATLFAMVLLAIEILHFLPLIVAALLVLHIARLVTPR
jgi:hypothetical protein